MDPEAEVLHAAGRQVPRFLPDDRGLALPCLLVREGVVVDLGLGVEESGTDTELCITSGIAVVVLWSAIIFNVTGVVIGTVDVTIETVGIWVEIGPIWIGTTTTTTTTFVESLRGPTQICWCF